MIILTKSERLKKKPYESNNKQKNSVNSRHSLKTFVHLRQHTNRCSFYWSPDNWFCKVHFLFHPIFEQSVFGKRLTNRNIRFLESWQTLRINKHKWSFTLFVQQELNEVTFDLTLPCPVFDTRLACSWPSRQEVFPDDFSMDLFVCSSCERAYKNTINIKRDGRRTCTAKRLLQLFVVVLLEAKGT